MAIPAHEMVPPNKGKAGRKPGAKSDSLQVLKRVVQIGQMLHIEGMTLTEIYQWNQEPERATEWGYSVMQISNMVVRAKKLGADLLVKDYQEALRGSLRRYYDLKRKAIAAGDMRVAFMCNVQIDKMEDMWVGKISRAKKNPVSGEPFKWAELPAPATEATACPAPPTAAEEPTGNPPEPPPDFFSAAGVFEDP